MDKLRIFLAEDYSLVREGLKLLVNAQPDMEVIGEARDGQAAIQQAIELQPDVVLVDAAMPELDGPTAARQLTCNSSQIKVLAFNVNVDEGTGYLRQLLEAGASGCIMKRAEAEELINAIRIVSRNGTYLDPALAGKAASSFLSTPAEDGPPAENSLSQREREVVRMIAHGFSNKEIAAQLNISVKTVETYKARAMEKLEISTRAGLVCYALEQGWLKT